MVWLSCRISSGPVCRAVEHVLRVADTLLVSLEVPGVVRRVLKIFNATVSRGVPWNIMAGIRIVLFKKGRKTSKSKSQEAVELSKLPF